MSALGPDLREGNEHGDSAVLRHVLGLIANEQPEGWALEFGVGGGNSLALIADVIPVLGFDGFVGLPEDWRPGFGKGMFRQDKISSIENATVVVGLFEDTLPDFDWPDAVPLVHLDADLYSSTATALKHCGHLIQPGTYVVMDEYHGYDDDVTGEIPGEQRAWREWADSELLITEVIGHGREQFAVRVIGRGERVDA